MLKETLKKSSSLLSYLSATLIRFLRPFFGPARCKFAIGCTQFAITQLKTQNFLYACLLIFKRLLLCSPLGSLYLHIRSRINQ